MSDFLKTFLENFLSDILPWIVVSVGGLILIKFFMSFLKTTITKSKLDPLCHKFILSIVKISSYTFLVIIVLSGLGINMTSLVAMLSVAGLAVSLSIQDSLSNISGGFIILMTKPFKVNDFVEIGDIMGTVSQISILQTKLYTIDNKQISIPNGQVSSAVIVNFSACTTRRLDIIFSIGYSDDFNKAKQIISDIITNHPLALDEPAPVVRVCEMAASSINITSRVWVSTENYWNLNFDLLEQVKTAFDKEGISIPFNQLDVHMIND